MIYDYGDFVNELENRYDSIISSVAPIGQQLTNRIQTSPEDKLLIIAHDTLKRLVCNIRVLKGIKISDDTCVAYRLILRATTADLIECFYLLAVSEEKRDQEIWKRNLEGVRTLEIYASEKKKFIPEVLIILIFLNFVQNIMNTSIRKPMSFIPKRSLKNSIQEI